VAVGDSIRFVKCQSLTWDTKVVLGLGPHAAGGDGRADSN